MFRAFSIAILLALTVTAAQAGAFQVSFADLNLANPADAHVLEGRFPLAEGALFLFKTSC